MRILPPRPCGKRGAVPAEQAAPRQGALSAAGGTQHELDDSVDIAVARGQRADVDPDAACDPGSAFDFAGQP
jgi:hypothetical protein